MKYFLTNATNANTDVTITDKPSLLGDSKEISEQEALEILYKEVDPMRDYPLSDYKLIYSEGLGRYGITYK